MDIIQESRRDAIENGTELLILWEYRPIKEVVVCNGWYMRREAPGSAFSGRLEFDQLPQGNLGGSLADRL